MEHLSNIMIRQRRALIKDAIFAVVVVLGAIGSISTVSTAAHAAATYRVNR